MTTAPTNDATLLAELKADPRIDLARRELELLDRLAARRLASGATELELSFESFGARRIALRKELGDQSAYEAQLHAETKALADEIARPRPLRVDLAATIGAVDDVMIVREVGEVGRARLGKTKDDTGRVTEHYTACIPGGTSAFTFIGRNLWDCGLREQVMAHARGATVPGPAQPIVIDRAEAGKKIAWVVDDVAHFSLKALVEAHPEIVEAGLSGFVCTRTLYRALAGLDERDLFYRAVHRHLGPHNPETIGRFWAGGPVITPRADAAAASGAP